VFFSEEVIMGLFDMLAKDVLSKFAGGGGQNPLLDAALSLITNPKTGGLQGLVENFKGKGLEDLISSWIGTGQNKPIFEDQLSQALGDDRIKRIAETAGISHEEASGGLAKLLPEIIDKLTPNGKLPEGGLLDEFKKMIKSKVDV
jgi:uncharacterized protein YidB (DUF937 family)